MRRVRVVGCGSPLCTDDGAGLWAAEALRATLPPEVDIQTDTAGGANLYAWCQGVDALVVIDAAEATPDFPPGTVRCVNYRAEPHALQTLRISGTHGIGLPEALTLAKQLDDLPQQVFIYAIAAERFEQGELLSEALRQTLTNLVRSLRSDVLAMLQGEPRTRSP